MNNEVTNLILDKKNNIERINSLNENDLVFSEKSSETISEYSESDYNSESESSVEYKKNQKLRKHIEVII